MAELVGVVASGISIGALAAQIAASISKLKSYWNEIQEAPDDIASLIEEISDLHMLLADIEDDQRRNPMSSLLLDSTASSRCLEHCKRAADRLSELVDEVASDIQSSSGVKRRWASAKVVLKKDSLEKYRSKLERAIRLMTLSHQCYTRYLKASYSTSTSHELIGCAADLFKSTCAVAARHNRLQNKTALCSRAEYRLESPRC
jgi:hypothetical protein